VRGPIDRSDEAHRVIRQNVPPTGLTLAKHPSRHCLRSYPVDEWRPRPDRVNGVGMNRHNDEKKGWVRGSSLFSRGGTQTHDDKQPDAGTPSPDPYGDRVADLVRSLDSNPASRKPDPPADPDSRDPEPADPGLVDPEPADPERADPGLVDPEPADPGLVDPEPGAAEQVLESSEVEAGVDSAARVLSLAQKLHDEYVAEGQNTRDRLISEGQATSDQLVSEGEARRLTLIAEADAIVVEAQQKKAAVLEGLGAERRSLEAEIDGLRSFERDYRAHLRSYLTGQLTELEQPGADETSADEASPDESDSLRSGEATQPAMTQPAVTQLEATPAHT
jgi:hypothetical protein